MIHVYQIRELQNFPQEMVHRQIVDDWRKTEKWFTTKWVIWNLNWWQHFCINISRIDAKIPH